MYDALYDAPLREARKWATFCHLGGLARLTPIPFGGIVVPLIVWLAKRDDDPYIDEQGREAVNFQMSMSLYNLVLVVTLGILPWFLGGFMFWPLFAVIWLAEVGGCIYAATQAYSGAAWRYPVTIRFIS